MGEVRSVVIDVGALQRLASEMGEQLGRNSELLHDIIVDIGRSDLHSGTWSDCPNQRCSKAVDLVRRYEAME